MAIRIDKAKIRCILTRSSGYLKDVSSHSLQPYRGCSFGSALCGVGCYVQHNGLLTRGAAWGSFLEARVNAAESYLEHYAREQAWARRVRGRFSIFMSSSTDPFVPHERRLGITARVLEAMITHPPDTLIVQTHTDAVVGALPTLECLSEVCALRVQISIESDRDSLPGLPPPASSVAHRLEAARTLRQAGVRTVITVAPLLPIAAPREFFAAIAAAADAVVIDHYIEGDGSRDGSRTARTPLPAAMEAIHPGSTRLEYRDLMVEAAEAVMPGRVGISRNGFAGRYDR
jgi:DNA repair photolyase